MSSNESPSPVATAAPTQHPSHAFATKGCCVAGIDVGGDRKGFHLVVLRDSEIVCSTRSRDPKELVRQCDELGVVAVGVDAPCKWGEPGFGRLAEKQLAKAGIISFSTPSRARASGNKFYGWMFNGERMYQALLARYPLFDGSPPPFGRVCFETFPHAVTCAFLGTDVTSARLKRVQRGALLRQHGIATAVLKSIDATDAALCALTAGYLLRSKVRRYGDPAGGHLLVPAVIAHPTLPAATGVETTS